MKPLLVAIVAMRQEEVLKISKLLMVAVEKLADGRIGNIALKHIENFEANTFHQAVDEMISQEAQITTDDFPSWQALKQKLPALETKKSGKGKGFKELHVQIMLIKLWLRGIHHKCSPVYLQSYLNEYAFRFNNRNCRHRIFHGLLSNMIHLKPHPFTRRKSFAL